MPTVFIPAALRSFAGGAPKVEVEGSNVRQVIASLDARFPGFAGALISNGELSANLMVSVDGAVQSRGLLAAVPLKSEVHFLPAIGGG